MLSPLKRSLAILIPYIWPRGWLSRTRLVIAVGALLASKLVTLILPFFYKKSIDSLSSHVPQQVLIPWAIIGAYGAARISISIFEYVRSVLFNTVVFSVVHQLRLRLFMQIHRLALAFHIERQTGGLLIALARGVDALQTILNDVVFGIGPAFIETVLVCLTLSRFYNFSYGVVISVFILIYAIWTIVVTEIRIENIRVVNNTYEETSTKTVDSMLNYEAIKHFCKEQHEYSRFEQAHGKYINASIHNANTISRIALVENVLVGLCITIIMFMGANDVSNHNIKVSDYIVINTFILQLFMPLGALGALYLQSRRAFVDMESTFDVLNSTPEIEDSSDARPLQIKAGEVRFEEVRFGYRHDRTILQEITFTVPAGKTVALVGATGAGKSTLLKLLLRFYDVSAGRILIDGQDIRNITQQSLRSAIGVVPQDVVLFNDTIYYNIAFGYSGSRGKPTVEEVERAAKLARIHDFICRLPEGYETRVGERGLRLSGGERQRLAIARAILKSPPIFLFDEATSALDNRTESEIQACLQEIALSHTMIVIAHRLSTVVDADEIVVFDKGRIVEHGKHDFLLEKNCQYARMWSKQNLNESLEKISPPQLPLVAR